MSTTKQWIVEAHHAIAGPVPMIKDISKGRALEEGSQSPSNQFDHQAFMCSLQRLEEIAKHLNAFVYTCPHCQSSLQEARKEKGNCNSLQPESHGWG
jgi:hypothetical protein